MKVIAALRNTFHLWAQAFSTKNLKRSQDYVAAFVMFLILLFRKVTILGVEMQRLMPVQN